MSLDEEHVPVPKISLRSDSCVCPTRVRLADARAVSPYIAAALDHPKWNKESVLVQTATPEALGFLVYLISQYSSLDSVEYTPPCPVRLANRDLTELVRIGEGGPVPSAIAADVVALWCNGVARSKVIFYDLIKALDYIHWGRMLEYFYCHIATVTLRYRDRDTSEIADAFSPHCNTREPSPLETGQKKRPNVFTSEKDAKRLRLEHTPHSE